MHCSPAVRTKPLPTRNKHHENTYSYSFGSGLTFQPQRLPERWSTGTPDSATFYLLASRTVEPVSCLLTGHSVYVRAVTLPGYLESGKIAIRSDYQVDYSIEHQWSESLQQSVTRCIGDALLSSVSPSSMASWPEPMTKNTDYLFQVNFTRLNGVDDGTIEIEGSWQVIDGRDHSLVRSGTFKDDSGTYNKTTTSSLVKGLSNALGRVSEQIIKEIGE